MFLSIGGLMPNVSLESIRMAVELAKAGMGAPMATGTMFNAPDSVAKFIEVVGKKIDELRSGSGRSEA
jgi:hypothetical protein